MLTLKSISITLFKIFIASYFISHGLNLSQHIDSAVLLAKQSFLNILSISLTITPRYMEIYSHLEVVIGVVLLMGWRSGRLLGLAAYLVNIFLLSSNIDAISIGKYSIISGLQILLCSLLLGVELNQPSKTAQ